MSITRREFLRSSAVAATAAVVFRSTRAADLASAQRPNIVFAVADDWWWAHAGAYGDRAVKTPAFDRVAREGALFANSFCAAPTCTASRGGILTGQPTHRLESGANLWSILPAKFATYPDMLEQTGYRIGFTGKGWGPGALGERKRNPAGPNFRNFDQFLDSVPKGTPFCYWFGSNDPHRPYERQLGRASGIRREDVVVPPFLPDAPEVRDDLIDYLAEVQRFDSQVGSLLKALDDRGLAENTLVIVTSDNGLPFPRAKANLYDSGTRMPLAMRWPGHIRAGTKVDALVSHLDFAPTFLDVAGLKRTAEMWGTSLLPVARGERLDRPCIFTERERHANARAGNVGYPCRAVRTSEYLYIRNFAPDRWPGGDPDLNSVQGTFSDIDSGPTKKYVLDHRDDPQVRRFFEMACAKRPAEELYEVRTDPYQLKNLADDAAHAQAKQRLRAQLDEWMSSTADPRATNPTTDEFDKYLYVTSPATRAARPVRQRG